MKTRSGFVSNSSSSSFIITNKSDCTLTLEDFCKDTVNATLANYNKRYGTLHTRKQVIDSVREYIEKVRTGDVYPGTNKSTVFAPGSCGYYVFSNYGDGGTLFEHIYERAYDWEQLGNWGVMFGGSV